MSDFKIHNSFEEAIEQFKAENPDCKISVFSGNPQEIIDGLELKEYPVPVDTSIPRYLIKIGKEEHILSLWKQGFVYMKPLSYFKNLEKTRDGRGDPDEGAHSIAQTSRTLIGELEIDIPTPITFSVSNINNGYVFCMVGIDDIADLKKILADNLEEMGGAFIIISNPEEFIKRCATVMQSNGIDLKWGRVRYYDKNEGSYLLDPWLKSKEYEKQSEFRLYFKRKEEGPAAIVIKSIEDIAEAYHIEKKQA